jgi:hypothetical protein
MKSLAARLSCRDSLQLAALSSPTLGERLACVIDEIHTSTDVTKPIPPGIAVIDMSMPIFCKTGDCLAEIGDAVATWSLSPLETAYAHNANRVRRP